MRLFELEEIARVLDYGAIVDRMRDALIAYSRGSCDTPMPMHLGIAPRQAEVHIKSSYCYGGAYFALKIAATFPGQGSNGMMLLSSADTGEPVAFLSDAGHLTDVRTAAVAAMTARELGRRDRVIGILGTGIQARLSAIVHADMLHAEAIVIWGRSREHAQECAAEICAKRPRLQVEVVSTTAEVARSARLIVTCTAAREALLHAADLQPDTHVSAIGADTSGKQELEPAVLRRAALVLADSRRQCEKLGELQHTPDLWGRSVEIGDYCLHPRELPQEAVTVADFTGLGVEDLFIAEYAYERLTAHT